MLLFLDNYKVFCNIVAERGKIFSNFHFMEKDVARNFIGQYYVKVITIFIQELNSLKMVINQKLIIEAVQIIVILN